MRLRPLVAPLLCLSLTSTIARADPPRVEAGVVTLDKWSNPAFEPMSSGGYGERVFDVDVPLRNAWNTPPLVVANLSMVDSDQSANLRLQIIVLSVGTNSFKLRFRTWADTKIWGAGASWFAIEAPPGTQPVPVLAPNPASAPDRVRVKSPGDDDSHLDRLPKRGPPPSCKRGTKFDCMPITSGVAPPHGEQHPSVCGCIPNCGTNYVFARMAEGQWPDGSQKGTFQCTNSLPP